MFVWNGRVDGRRAQILTVGVGGGNGRLGDGCAGISGRWCGSLYAVGEWRGLEGVETNPHSIWERRGVGGYWRPGGRNRALALYWGAEGVVMGWWRPGCRNELLVLCWRAEGRRSWRWWAPLLFGEGGRGWGTRGVLAGRVGPKRPPTPVLREGGGAGGGWGTHGMLAGHGGS